MRRNFLKRLSGVCIERVWGPIVRADVLECPVFPRSFHGGKKRHITHRLLFSSPGDENCFDSDNTKAFIEPAKIHSRCWKKTVLVLPVELSAMRFRLGSANLPFRNTKGFWVLATAASSLQNSTMPSYLVGNLWRSETVLQI